MSPLPLPRKGIETFVGELGVGQVDMQGLLYHFPERGLKQNIQCLRKSKLLGLLYHFPERGLKLKMVNGGLSHLSPLPLPRKGIETFTK